GGRQVSSDSVTRARDDLQHALALRSQMPSARQLMGRCLRSSGELTEARSTLERLYHQRPRQEGLAFELAQVYRDLRLTDRVGPPGGEVSGLSRGIRTVRSVPRGPRGLKPGSLPDETTTRSAGTRRGLARFRTAAAQSVSHRPGLQPPRLLLLLILAVGLVAS